MVKQKLLVVIPTIMSYEAFLKELFSELVIAGWEVTLICDTGNKDYTHLEGVVVRHCDMPRGMNFSGYFRAALRLRQIVKEVEPILIHVHFSAAALVMAIAKQFWWPKMIVTLQGVVYTAKRGLVSHIIKTSEIFAFRQFNQVWVLTSDDKLALQKENLNVFCQTSKGFGCRVDVFHPQRFDDNFKYKLRKDLGINSSDIVLAFVGRLVEFKGIHIAFKAFLKFKSSFPALPVKFLVIGDFDRLHPSGLTHSELSQLKNHPDVVCTGFVKNVDQYLAITDLNIFPSVREGMPVNLMESIAMGIPVITFNSRGCRDVVENESTGIVIDERTPEAFADGIYKLAVDVKLRQSYSQNALASRGVFARKKYIEEQIAIYNSIIS